MTLPAATATTIIVMNLAMLPCMVLLFLLVDSHIAITQDKHTTLSSVSGNIIDDIATPIVSVINFVLRLSGICVGIAVHADQACGRNVRA